MPFVSIVKAIHPCRMLSQVNDNLMHGQMLAAEALW